MQTSDRLDIRRSVNDERSANDGNTILVPKLGIVPLREEWRADGP